MKAYIYDNQGFYFAETVLQASPLEPGVYFEQPNTTTVVPPILEVNQTAYWNGKGWEKKPDYSGKTYYSKIDKSEKRFEKGEAFDDNYTELAPPSEPFQKWDEVGSKWILDVEKKTEFEKTQRLAQIQNLLLQSDYIELPSYLQRKGTTAYNMMMAYREELRTARHNSSLPIPTIPDV